MGRYVAVNISLNGSDGTRTRGLRRDRPLRRRRRKTTEDDRGRVSPLFMRDHARVDHIGKRSRRSRTADVVAL